MEEQGKKYYAMIDGQQRGPFDLSQLAQEGVRPSTYIWTKGLPDWEKAEENPDVCRFFRNHLYDVMHPSLAPQPLPGETPGQEVPELPNLSPTRFDRYLDPSESIPTIEEIDARENKDVPPMSMVGYAWLVTLLCFPFTGIAALIYAYKSKAEWKTGNSMLAHDYCRAAKMWTGISFFLGLILYAFLIAFL